MNKLKIGILGGIGPQATGYIYSQLISKLKRTGKIQKNSDFPNIIINSINAIELTNSKIFDEDLLDYIEGIKELSLLKPNFILLACNTIHVFRDTLIEQSGYRNILSIKEMVRNIVLKNKNDIYCILGTETTINSNLFFFENIKYINPEKKQLEKIKHIIESNNSSGEVIYSFNSLNQIIEEQRSKGVSKFIIACTELSDLLEKTKDDAFISTLDLMVDELYNRSISANN